uniref:hypothetical protein n=3 Tax=Barnesiella intestinihominis TaxID=487174 RepID=UPI003AF16699
RKRFVLQSHPLISCTTFCISIGFISFPPNPQYTFRSVPHIFFKLLISIFVHDYKNVLRQYRQAYTTQRQMEQYLRVITPEDLYDKELVRISERMSDLQKLIYQLRKKGLSDEAISRKLNLPLHKIQKHLDLVELDILQISRYFN